MLNKKENKRKFTLQENQYQFPYHHIPYFNNGVPMKTRTLVWGFEYLCYMKFVADMISNLQPTKILDVGCGDGRLFSLLGNLEAIQVGVDPVDRSVQLARAFSPHAEFKIGTAQDIDETYDVVVATEVLEHIPDEEMTRFIQTMYSKLSDGGSLIITVPSIAIPLQDKHFRHYTIDLLQSHLEEAGCRVELKDYKYVFYESRFIKVFNRITSNKLWTIEIPFFNKFVWSYVQNKLLNNKKMGKRLVTHFERVS